MASAFATAIVVVSMRAEWSNGCSGSSTGRSVADRDGYPAQRRARLSFADLERCVALAVIDHNLQQNAKTLKAPAAEWAQYRRDLPRFEDDPARVVLAFLPGAERRLSPQGVSWTIIRRGWAAWSRGATVWVGSRCDTTPATSATSISGIRKQGSFGASDGAMGGSLR